MGHAEHFLSRLDRVSGADLDLALTLYRDDVLVRHVLSTIELPEGVDRVALALRDEHRGPFVLVSREGRFITCLGEGMSPRPHPVVTPAQLGALTRDVFQCRALSRELDSEGDHKRALRWHRERLLHAGPALSREEFDFLQRFEPLLRGRYIYELSASLSGFWGCYRAMDRVHRSRLGEAHLRVLWEGSWMAQHLAVLASRGLEFGLLNGNLPEGYDLYGSVHMVAAMVSTSSVVRAAYLTAQVGTEALPFFEGVCTQGAQRVTDDFALVALARRHRSERSQVLAWIERSKLKHGPEADTYAALMQGALDVDREAAERRLAEFSLTCLSAEHAALSPAQRERVGPLEDVPTAVAAALLCAREGYYHSSPEALEATSHAVAWASTAEPEELFVPRQYTPLLGARWSPERSRALLDRIRGAHLRKTPARKDTQVGRNDECPCRSGRKYKRCCGAG